jgi:hypothetical protein
MCCMVMMMMMTDMIMKLPMGVRWSGRNSSRPGVAMYTDRGVFTTWEA